MYSLLFIVVVAFTLSVLLTPLSRNMARRWGALDLPDNKRKVHADPVPRVGGIPIVMACLVSLTLAELVNFRSGEVIRSNVTLGFHLFPAMAVVFLTGLSDDLRGLSPVAKLVGQLAASILAILAGVQIDSIAGHTLAPWVSVPITALWLIGCTNALNLIDGVDGLAAGIGLFATATTLIAALLQHNMALALATAPLVGALLGFLRYNFNPASIFLGDSGSLLIGFLLGCFGVLWSQKSATVLGMTAPLMALAIPLLDTCLAIARRFLRNQPIFGADRGHIHHKLLARGLTPRRVVLLIYFVCAISATLSLLQSIAYNEVGGIIIVLFCVGAWIGIQHLGYAEFDLAGRLLLTSTGTFRRLLSAQLQLQTFQENLIAAATPRECWALLSEAYSRFGFYSVELKLAGDSFYASTNGRHVPECWTITIPLSPSDFLRLSRESSGYPPSSVGAFADCLNKTLRAKLPEFAQYEHYQVEYHG